MKTEIRSVTEIRDKKGRVVLRTVTEGGWHRIIAIGYRDNFPSPRIETN